MSSETDNVQGSGSGELKIADLPFTTSRTSDTRGRGWCYFTMILKVRFKSCTKFGLILVFESLNSTKSEFILSSAAYIRNIDCRARTSGRFSVGEVGEERADRGQLCCNGHFLPIAAVSRTQLDSTTLRHYYRAAAHKHSGAGTDASPRRYPHGKCCCC